MGMFENIRQDFVDEAKSKLEKWCSIFLTTTFVDGFCLTRNNKKEKQA